MRPIDVAAALPRDVKKLLDGSQRRMLEAAHLGAEILANQAPVDVGSLKSSIHVETTEHGAKIVIDAPHAGIVELGSRPHWAPLAPLVAWVKRHRQSFGMAKRLPRGKARAAMDQEIEQIARGIQRKIAREGTKPRYFVRNAMPRITAALRKTLSQP